MPDTFEGLGVIVFALTPGAVFIWSFERIAGRWAIGASDRLLRFGGISLVFHALLAPVTYLAWHDQLQTGALKPGEQLPLWLWFVLLGYVALPIVAGTLLAISIQRNFAWARAFGRGLQPPTAWDAVFAGDPSGWVLMRLKSGKWIGGAYGKGSYASGYPEPADIFLSAEAIVDQQTESFVLDEAGRPELLDWGILIRWEEVEYLEITPTKGHA